MNTTLRAALHKAGFFDSAKRLKHYLHSHGYLRWEPLVPLADFTATLQSGIQLLQDRGHVFGDYLEFGVSRGTSMVGAYGAVRETGLTNVRLIGFDSFQGLPEEAVAEGWDRGAFASSLGATRAYLAANGTNLDRVHLVPGWFADTLTAETKATYELRKASLIMVDCDIYSASVDALNFVADLIDDAAVIVFDDWGARADLGEIGQKEAFAEMLAASPGLTATPLPGYCNHNGYANARVFLIARS